MYVRFPTIQARQEIRKMLSSIHGIAMQHMKQQEEDHLRDVSHLLTERRARPTALLPFWNAAGYCLGVGTALLGREAAMACTVAVETAIGQHYDDQIRELLEKGYDEEELTQVRGAERFWAHTLYSF
eukprot:gb/GECG01006236.1/.p1 GENE.gb/GECG01006236.1/~~gb/GECG01006236.1/.p1  ORF type:complete len:127 (+),score=17.46 gb/GECG01006236.1/:1-381(+)